MRWFLALLFTVGLGSIAFAQGIPSAATWTVFAFNYNNITTDATTQVKAGAGVLGSICPNTTAAGETITIYDSLTGSGTKIGTITLSSTSIGCFYYNIVFKTGLTIVTATAAGDITIGYQ